jgi:hypothetical protein
VKAVVDPRIEYWGAYFFFFLLPPIFLFFLLLFSFFPYFIHG